MYKPVTVVESGDHPDINMYHQFGTVVTKDGTVLVTCEARVGSGDCDNPSSIFLWRSTDGGETWSAPVTWTSIGSYANCDSGFTSQIVGSSTQLVTVHPFDTTNRDNLYAYVSYDNGKTWSFSKKIWSMTLSERGTGACDTYLIGEDTYGVVHGTSLYNNNVEYIIFNISYVTGMDDDSIILPAYEYEAQIGVTNYCTLEDAVDSAAEGDVIVIKAAAISTNAKNISKNVTVDLNGINIDLNDLCAEGYLAKQDSAAGLWTICRK